MGSGLCAGSLTKIRKEIFNNGYCNKLYLRYGGRLYPAGCLRAYPLLLGVRVHRKHSLCTYFRWKGKVNFVLWIVIIIICFLSYLSVCFRVIITNPVKTAVNGVVDFYKYIRFFQWRNCKTGELRCFVGLFGKGKTLSAVHYVVSKYNQYNNKRIYDFDRRKWVTQRVHIISNVELSIPYEKFESLSQIVSVAENMRSYDRDNDTLTVTLVLGDEFSVQLNSRNFKSNIDPCF